MDALHAFGINWKLLLIQGVNFALVLLILHRFLYKPLFALLDKRQRVIEKGLKDAQEASHEKEKVAGEKASILADAREEGGKITDGLRKHATEDAGEVLRGAQERSAALISEARVKAEAEREHILRESEKEIARMAVLAAEKIMRGSHQSSVISH